jgi:biopolymer transport protein ExbB
MDILFIIALVITSVISMTYIVERSLALRWKRIIPGDVEAGVLQYQPRTPEDLSRLRWTCEANPSPISRLLLFCAEHLAWSREENSNVLETRARHEVSRMERGLVVLEIIVGIAPLLGLVGTIYGLILLFGSMGELNAGETTRFAEGISLALNATLLGLVIAIPTLVAWSYLSKKVENLSVEMETLCDEFLRKQYHYAAVQSVAAPDPVLTASSSQSPADSGTDEASSPPKGGSPGRTPRRTAQG